MDYKNIDIEALRTGYKAAKEKQIKNLREMRPESSISNILRDIYFNKKRASWNNDELTYLMPDVQFILLFDVCINDEEKFWYSMIYIRDQNSNPSNRKTFKMCAEFIANNADKFDSSEAAKLLLKKSG